MVSSDDHVVDDVQESAFWPESTAAISVLIEPIGRVNIKMQSKTFSTCNILLEQIKSFQSIHSVSSDDHVVDDMQESAFWPESTAAISVRVEPIGLACDQVADGMKVSVGGQDIITGAISLALIDIERLRRSFRCFSVDRGAVLGLAFERLVVGALLFWRRAFCLSISKPAAFHHPPGKYSKNCYAILPPIPNYVHLVSQSSKYQIVSVKRFGFIR